MIADAAPPPAKRSRRSAVVGGPSSQNNNTKPPVIFDAQPCQRGDGGPCDGLVAAALSDAYVRVRDVRAPAKDVAPLARWWADRVTSLAWAPVGASPHALLAATSATGDVAVYDPRAGFHIARVSPPSDVVARARNAAVLERRRPATHYGCAWLPASSGGVRGDQDTSAAAGLPGVGGLVTWASDGTLDFRLADSAPVCVQLDFPVFHCSVDADTFVAVGGDGGDAFDEDAVVAVWRRHRWRDRENRE
mmetsp:Transcript_7719/g.31944  ORF Transcript_7719/g.31944 Transcript_7719/m.31944 type:complete len:248 (-) Transcript_7719:1083-1826(-)